MVAFVTHMCNFARLFNLDFVFAVAVPRDVLFSNGQESAGGSGRALFDVSLQPSHVCSYGRRSFRWISRDRTFKKYRASLDKKSANPPSQSHKVQPSRQHFYLALRSKTILAFIKPTINSLCGRAGAFATHEIAELGYDCINCLLARLPVCLCSSYWCCSKNRNTQIFRERQQIR